MKCPVCDTWTTVKDTRRKENNVRYRRYECGNTHRFITLETIVRLVKPKTKTEK